VKFPAGRTLWIAALSCCAFGAARATAATAPAKAAPAPYQSIEVRVKTRDGQTLAGTLTRPAGVAKVPSVLLVSSADATDRDASNNHGLYHPMRQIADTLSRHGIAVLRLDDRGKGQSTGRLDTLNTAERANDARDALQFLRARSDIDRRRIAILGHSEGALIASMLGAEDTTIRALILMASTAHRGRTIVEWQQEYAMQRAPMSPAVRKKEMQQAMAEWNERLKHDRWSSFFDTYDPLIAARRIKAPVLILQGTSDMSCPPPEATTLESAIKSGGNGDVTLMKIESVDHAFLDVSGFQNGVAYGDGAFLVPSRVLAAILDWAVPHLR